MIESKIICDSIAEHSPRLVTMFCKYPKFVHGEHLRHRSFSFSVSSSRAIPVSKNLEEVRSDELRAAPIWWGKEQKGMTSGEELDDDDCNPVWIGFSAKKAAQIRWREAARTAAEIAENLAKIGAHKSIVNRLLEPFLHVNVLVIGTEPGWMNFFGLRLDKAAQPEIRVLAEAQWKCWNEGKPEKLEAGQWHLPFISDEDSEAFASDADQENCPLLEQWIKISVARCARLSYLSFETNKRSTIEEDLKLYDRLAGSSPIHASPAEHQATPDEFDPVFEIRNGVGIWLHSSENGNLGAGWRQYRKMLPGEACALLLEEYR